MMSRRIKPYELKNVDWKTILDKKLRIPMNQREYSWEKNEIIKFLTDIFNIFEEEKYVEKMGAIINLQNGDENDVYDGQQRILTTILILSVISSICPKLKNKIYSLLTIDTEIDTLTERQVELKRENGATYLPKIYCVNPYDMTGLVRIFNGKLKSWIEYLSNPRELRLFEDEEDEEEDEEEERVWKCNLCSSKTSTKQNFIKHIKNHHEYFKYNNDTKLYDGYIEIFNYFFHKNYEEKKLISLYNFILEDIRLEFYDCIDPVYVSRIFDWENNRGKHVETLDIIKNPILVKISESKKIEIYEKWENLKHTDNKIYKNYGQKIFDVAIQIYNKKIMRKFDQVEFFKPIIESEDVYEKVNDFFKIVEDLFNIMKQISEDKFGRLINDSSRVCLSWEAYMWLLLPIFYIRNTIDTKLIRLLVNWNFRQISRKLFNLNKLSYSNEFIRICKETIKSETYDYYKEVENCLKRNKSECIKGKKYVDGLVDLHFTTTNAKYLLLFLETCENTDLHIVPLDYSVEHIYPKKDKGKLRNTLLLNNIGNLTLYEKKNSENKHQGNSSLGAKPYSKKKEQYLKSNSKITRETSLKFTTFGEKEINPRCLYLSELLNEHTDY